MINFMMCDQSGNLGISKPISVGFTRKVAYGMFFIGIPFYIFTVYINIYRVYVESARHPDKVYKYFYVFVIIFTILYTVCVFLPSLKKLRRLTIQNNTLSSASWISGKISRHHLANIERIDQERKFALHLLMSMKTRESMYVLTLKDGTRYEIAIDGVDRTLLYNFTAAALTGNPQIRIGRNDWGSPQS
ncbi:hypothetical protein [Deinococcus sonorensis]|uniref:hypothetical protein n=1 Tax=Deinococcus sonorensis TaxID=309891 RepID=UPI0036D2BC9B